jgi:hypothetical protein
MKTGRGTPVLLGLALVIGAVFVAGFVFPYFALNQQTFGSFWPERGWLLLHIVAGMAALLLGPFVLWLGLNRRRMSVHRRLGIGYMTSVGLSGIGALYLAFHTDLGWEYAMGLVGLATAWLVTTGLALASIRRRLIEQHKEWMIRSYVVTFGFVNFRILAGVLQIAGIGTLIEQLDAASWFCWSIPLLITEAVLQGGKIFSARDVVR